MNIYNLNLKGVNIRTIIPFRGCMFKVSCIHNKPKDRGIQLSVHILGTLFVYARRLSACRMCIVYSVNAFCLLRICPSLFA